MIWAGRLQVQVLPLLPYFARDLYARNLLFFRVENLWQKSCFCRRLYRNLAAR
jgi:hypothetical protein